MAPVSHGTSACASSAFTPPITNKIGAIGAVGAMVPAYFSMTGDKDESAFGLQWTNRLVAWPSQYPWVLAQVSYPVS